MVEPPILSADIPKKVQKAAPEPVRKYSPPSSDVNIQSYNTSDIKPTSSYSYASET